MLRRAPTASFQALLVLLCASLISCGKTSSGVKSDDLSDDSLGGPAPTFELGMATGMGTDAVNRKVPVEKVLLVMPPTKKSSGLLVHLGGIYYCRHVGKDRGGQGTHEGLSTGTTLMTPFGVAVGTTGVIFPEKDQGNYGFNDSSHPVADFAPVSSMAGFQLSFKDATHADLYPTWRFDIDLPLAGVVPASTRTGYSMEWIDNDPMYVGGFWLRHSRGQDDYNLIPIATSDGKPNANYFDYFLPDMAAAQIDTLDIAVNSASTLGQPGSPMPADSIKASDRAKYIGNGIGDNSGSLPSIIRSNDHTVHNDVTF